MVVKKNGASHQPLFLPRSGLVLLTVNIILKDYLIVKIWCNREFLLVKLIHYKAFFNQIEATKIFQKSNLPPA